ncbi:EpsG family protein [Morganella morganii]|uniref:EpsG family protein n=1 Tax=Morganella morganii TaxID=582 RepID=UPI0030B9C40B
MKSQLCNISIIIASTILLGILAIYQPFIILMLLSIMLIVNKNIRFLLVSVSLILSLSSFTINYNEYYPDVVRYYSDFNTNVYLALAKFKLYRFAIFLVMDSMNLYASFYSFITLFLFFYFLLKSCYNYLICIDYELNTIKRIIVFLFIILTGVPFTIYFSFENLFGIIIFNYALSLYCLKKTKQFIIFLIIAVLVHSSIIILLAIMLVSVLIDKKIIKKASAAIGLMILFVTISFLLNFEVKVGIEFLDSLLNKAYRYGNNEWSTLTRSEILHYIPYVVLKLSLAISMSLALLKNPKYKNINPLLYFIIFYSLTILLFMYNRMFSIRFGWSISLISFIIAYVYIMNFKTQNIKKIIVLACICICLISIPNVFILSKFGTQITFQNSIPFFNSINDINREIPIPNREILNKIEQKTLNERE